MGNDMLLRRCLLAALLLGMLTALTSPAAADEADDLARQIAPFVEGQTLLVAHVDLSRVDVEGALGRFAPRFDIPEDQILQAQIASGGVLSAMRLALGAPHDSPLDAYAVMSLRGINSPVAPTLLVIPTGENANRELLYELLGSLGADSQQMAGCLVLAQSDRTLALLDSLEPLERPELAEAFRALEGSHAKVVLLPPTHAKKVIEDIMPELPEPIGGGPSTIVTRGFLWAAIGLDISAEPRLRVLVQSESEEDAEAADALLDRLVAFLKSQEAFLREVEEAGMSTTVDRLIEIFNPRVEGDRLTVTLDEGRGDVSHLVTTLQPIIHQFQEEAMRSRSLSNLKRIGVAFHMYADGHGQAFPPAHSVDGEKKPLLSWRVHVLPYLGHANLYEEFRLDEPWDSDHNRSLVPRMPDVYIARIDETAEAGKTRYRAVTGDGTMFEGAEGKSIKNPKQNLSRTPLVMIVDSEEGVVWTKPADFPVGGRKVVGPWAGAVLFADGHIERVRVEGSDRDLLEAIRNR